MRPFIILSGLLLVSSCVLGPQPGSPDVKLPAAIRGDSGPCGNSFGDKAWRKVFTDSTLRNLIERALANNPDLVAATFRIEQARALAAHDKASKQAFREAADSINAHVKTGEIIAVQTNLVNSYKRVDSVASERFQGGASSYLEVLDAERSLFSAELTLADARRDRLLSVVQAYRALGGGWK